MKGQAKDYKSSPVMLAPPQALAVCWQSDSVYFLDLSPRHCEREVEEDGGTTVLQRVAAVLASPGSHKLCFEASKMVQLLLQEGRCWYTTCFL